MQDPEKLIYSSLSHRLILFKQIATLLSCLFFPEIFPPCKVMLPCKPSQCPPQVSGNAEIVQALLDSRADPNDAIMKAKKEIQMPRRLSLGASPCGTLLPLFEGSRIPVIS